MNVLIRAKRVLFRMSRFMEKRDEIDEVLGQMIGVYDNSPENDSLKIYEAGIGWDSENGYNKLVFKEMEKIDLKDHNKMGDFINITLKNKTLLQLPVRGKINRCSDICEFLRFLDRVKSDISSQVDDG